MLVVVGRSSARLIGGLARHGKGSGIGPGRLATTDSALPGGAGLVGISNPNLMPAVVAVLVQARSVVECRSLTLAQVRQAARLSLELAPGRFATPTLALQGVEAR